MTSIIAKAVVYSLSDHLLRHGKGFLDDRTHDHFSNVDIVLYLWGSDLKFPSEDMLYEYLEDEIDVVFTKMHSPEPTVKSAPELEKWMVEAFLKARQQRLHVVGKDQLKSWRMPSFLPLPELVQGVETAEGKEDTM